MVEMARRLIFLLICCLCGPLSATGWNTFNTNRRLNLSNLVILFDTEIWDIGIYSASNAAVRFIEKLGEMDDLSIQQYIFFPFNRDTTTENAYILKTTNIHAYETAVRNQRMNPSFPRKSNALLAIEHTLDMDLGPHTSIILVFSDGWTDTLPENHRITAAIQTKKIRVIFLVDKTLKPYTSSLVPHFEEIAAASETQIFNYDHDVENEISKILQLIRQITIEESQIAHTICVDVEFLCDHNRSVPITYRCDGQVNCQDGSDEKNCTPPTTTRRPCLANQFACKSDTSICISTRWQCDGEKDCPDNSDEEHCEDRCRSYEFSCENKKCIIKAFTCDGMNDCGDNSDEKDCPISGTKLSSTTRADSRDNFTSTSATESSSTSTSERLSELNFTNTSDNVTEITTEVNFGYNYTVTSTTEYPSENNLSSSTNIGTETTSEDPSNYNFTGTSSTEYPSEYNSSSSSSRATETTWEDTTTSVIITSENPSKTNFPKNTSSAVEAISGNIFTYNYSVNLNKAESISGAVSRNYPSILGKSPLNVFFRLNSSTNIQGSISIQSPVSQTSTNFNNSSTPFVNLSNILCSIFGNAFCK